MSINPNDISAKVYDAVNKPLKNDEVLMSEVGLIKSLAPKQGKILDIGCGTGRHIVELLKQGFEVFGIDASSKMIEVLRTKSPSIETKVIDVLKYKTTQRFDLIILMWNSFNEIALNTQKAYKLLGIIHNSLKRSGSLLINIDDPANINIPLLNFKTVHEERGYTYSQDWHVVKYIPESLTTISQEIIQVSDQKNNLHFQSKSEIRQRWWSRGDLQHILELKGFKARFVNLAVNGEIYCIGT